MPATGGLFAKAPYLAYPSSDPAGRLRIFCNLDPFNSLCCPLPMSPALWVPLGVWEGKSTVPVHSEAGEILRHGRWRCSQLGGWAAWAGSASDGPYQPAGQSWSKSFWKLHCIVSESETDEERACSFRASDWFRHCDLFRYPTHAHLQAGAHVCARARTRATHKCTHRRAHTRIVINTHKELFVSRF